MSVYGEIGVARGGETYGLVEDVGVVDFDHLEVYI